MNAKSGFEVTLSRLINTFKSLANYTCIKPAKDEISMNLFKSANWLL